MKVLAVALGVVALFPLLLCGAGLVVGAAASNEATHGTSSGCQAELDSRKVTQQVSALLDGGDASAVHIKGLDAPGEQIQHAQTIVATGQSLNVPRRGQVVALATALQESRLRNLNSGDRDSLGLFQQRPSQGWGTTEQIRDPVYATERFYKALRAVHGWQQQTITHAAQEVQKSAFPHAYAQWEPLATALQRSLSRNNGPPEKQAAPECAEPAAAVQKIPEGALPKGYTIPQRTNSRARTAITWGLQQLGTMYQWGGSCTNPRGEDPMGRCDCSSLMQQAYKRAGIRLTRTTYTQVRDGRPVSLRQRHPGDLLFSRGTATAPEHVGMYLGRGLVLEAPRSTKPVRITPLTEWAVLGVRRVT